MSKPAKQLRARQLRGRAARLSDLLPSGPHQAARTPFVLLVVVLLGGGLICLLILNSALNEGSFRLNDLKKQTTELTDEEQALQRDVDDRSAPGALERRARELGMVPGGSPAFLDPDGKVRGTPSQAPPPEPAPEPVRPQRAPAPPPPAAATAPPAGRVPPANRSPAPPQAPPAASTTPPPAQHPPTTSGR
ncbi:septum formation initiator family protein [Streptomyces sp. NPDC021093]|uniref:septum formation initiator family protein n=1 Tax=Streptomyces sp. NPDC021093 TaxID=3365112 RepID=UPI0037A38A5D